MGYTTDFTGRFELNKPLTVPDFNYLKEFAEGNHEEPGSPGSWCQWIPSKDGMGIEWDGGEKFYNYTEWLEYLIKEFFEPKGYVLNGSVRFQGEEFDDVGNIHVKDNVVTTEELKVVGAIECPHCGERFVPDEE